MSVCLSSFFFQAEDGIRDTSVTGVQTCALPISLCRETGSAVSRSGWRLEASERRRDRHRTKRSMRLNDVAVQLLQIGRASCRERVEVSVVAGAVQKKKV